ncbi:MAG: sugar phosphate isomerase/epimerase [Bacteroidota bacterium]|nr:sugar phosphate isomerase/epimerase [Bacteroidota bacterium]
MTISRRSFVKNSSLALAGVALTASLVGFKSPADILGVQLYSVRDAMKKDPAGTLKKIAAMGYRYVEHAGYDNGKFYGYSPADFKKLLSDLGLKMDSGHDFLGSRQWDPSKNDFTDAWKQTIDDAVAVGMKYMISPGVDEAYCHRIEDFHHYMDMFNKTGALAKKAGIHFAYHNEGYEFNHSLNGTRLYDIILRTTDPNLVDQQMDIGNMYEPGGRAMSYLKEYPGRFLLMHVKNEIKGTKPSPSGEWYESSLLNKGVIPVKEIVDYARRGGTKYFIIEQENYQNLDPVDCVRDDLKIMKSWGF